MSFIFSNKVCNVTEKSWSDNKQNCNEEIIVIIKHGHT